MDTTGAAEHVCVDAVASSSSEVSGVAEQHCLNATRESTSNVAEHARVYAVAFSLSKPTIEEIQARKLYDAARENLHITQQLRAQLHTSKGKGKGKFKADRLRSWWDMSPSEQWWLDQLWSGRLHKQLVEARKQLIALAQADRNTMRRFQ